jgi:hypothetical protein
MNSTLLLPAILPEKPHVINLASHQFSLTAHRGVKARYRKMRSRRRGESQCLARLYESFTLFNFQHHGANKFISLILGRKAEAFPQAVKEKLSTSSCDLYVAFALLRLPVAGAESR